MAGARSAGPRGQGEDGRRSAAYPGIDAFSKRGTNNHYLSPYPIITKKNFFF